MEKDFSKDVPEILAQIEQGSDSATGRLLSVLYKELRALAGGYFRLQDSDHTLQPTALVHEAFIKLTGSTGTGGVS